jgi:NADH-quinone oxidoreductase subunit A
MFSGFGPILLFLAISIGISFAVVSIPFFVSRFVTKTYKPDPEKNSIYECGFNPIEQFSVSPSKFNVKYFLVAILFIIFDIEIALLLPWALHVKQIGAFGFISILIFTIILTLGLLYEWKSGAVDI